MSPASTIADTLTPDAVILQLPQEKEAAFIALLARLAGRVGQDEKSLLAAVLAREAIITTGMGHGVGVPHAKIGGIKKSVLAVGISKQGIDYGALDGSVVKIVALFLTPQNNPAEHVQFLADLTKRLKYAHLRQEILDATTPEEVVSAFA